MDEADIIRMIFDRYINTMHEQCVVEMQEGSPNLTKGYWKGK